MSQTIEQVQDVVVAEFNALDDWMDKYQYLIDLGKKMAPMEEVFRTDENAISGCQSRVWVHAELKDGRLKLSADSNAQITRGIIALLLRVLDGRTPKEIADGDLSFIERTGLRSNLSPARADGLDAILERIRRFGRLYTKPNPEP